MAIKAVTFDAYGTLLRNEDLMLVPRRIVADHGLSVRIDDVLQRWIDLYFEATQQLPFQTLREIEGQILPGAVHRHLRGRASLQAASAHVSASPGAAGTSTARGSPRGRQRRGRREGREGGRPASRLAQPHGPVTAA